MPDTYFQRPTWAEINLDNLAFNFQSVKKFIGDDLKYMAVVKADGYGHGSIKCAQRLENEGIDWFGVAIPEEGVELRKNGIRKLILCLGGFWNGQEELMINHHISPVLFQLEKAQKLNKIAENQGIVVDIHVKIDTGMGRIGIRPEEVEEFADKLKKLHNLNLAGIMTHFASADNLAENEFTDNQIKKFYEAVNCFEEKGFRPIYKDLANSPGAIAHENSHGNMVRLGGILYGLGDDVLPKQINKPELKPVMSLYSQITYLKRVPKGETLGYSRTFETQRDSLIATIPIGYQDGLPRGLSNKGRVIVNGKYAPIVGRISMDWTILDVTDIPKIKLDDKVIIIGEQDGLKVTAEEIARKTDTISYEITCGINRRVVRKYVES